MVSTTITKDNRSMYLTNKINFLREHVDSKIISLQYIETESLRVVPHNDLSAKLLMGIKSSESTI
jgi:hypothetical protein